MDEGSRMNEGSIAHFGPRAEVLAALEAPRVRLVRAPPREAVS